MLEVKALKKSYGDFSVSLDLQVDEGETLALVGPSGAGKTTALSLISGLAEPDSGKVISNGENITGLPSYKRNISVVFQDLALFPHLNTGGNIAYGLFIQRVPKKERRRIVEETLNIVRLPGYASRRIETLSGGERQRVAIARALASNPRALLLDEPFSSLDAPLRQIMRREFLQIRAHSKVPCIFVTHDREEAMMLGDRIALMIDGRIAETGTGRELFLEPKTEKAARFFGAGQVLSCTILGNTAEGTEVASPLGNLTVPNRGETDVSSSLLFIPHDAVFYKESSGGPERKSFNARCIGSFFEGRQLVLKFILPGEESVPFEIGVSPRTPPPASGSVVNLQVDQNLLRFVKILFASGFNTPNRRFDTPFRAV